MMTKITCPHCDGDIYLNIVDCPCCKSTVVIMKNNRKCNVCGCEYDEIFKVEDSPNVGEKDER